jgi:hypothetical protein
MKFFSLLPLFLFFQHLGAQNCSVNAGVPINYCPGDVMTLYGNIAGLYNPTSISWTRISGPAVTFANSNSLTTTAGTAVAGATYVFRLSAACQDGQTIVLPISQTKKIKKPKNYKDTNLLLKNE